MRDQTSFKRSKIQDTKMNIYQEYIIHIDWYYI